MTIFGGSAWKRRGSSIIFDQEEIQALLNANAMISLREFLSWKENIPENPPIEGQTLLVCGLETLMDTLPAQEAQTFLETRIRPLIKEIQDVWTETGIIFGFSQGSQVFQETSGSREEVLFLRNDDQKVRISEGLWDGTATLNMQRLEKEFISEHQKVTIGYYVARIS